MDACGLDVDSVDAEQRLTHRGTQAASRPGTLKGQAVTVSDTV